MTTAVLYSEFQIKWGFEDNFGIKGFGFPIKKIVVTFH